MVKQKSDRMINDRSDKMTNATKLLMVFADLADNAAGQIGAFLLSGGSARLLRHNIGMLDKEYDSAFQGLRQHGYIKKISNNQFLITPKAHIRIKVAQIENSDWQEMEWGGSWKLIAFDIPETKKRERNIFRSIIKRKGFIGIQNSVFVAPRADFEALADLRKELKIEKFVSFFCAKSYKTDDDSELKKIFDL